MYSCSLIACEVLAAACRRQPSQNSSTAVWGAGRKVAKRFFSSLGSGLAPQVSCSAVGGSGRGRGDGAGTGRGSWLRLDPVQVQEAGPSVEEGSTWGRAQDGRVHPGQLRAGGVSRWRNRSAKFGAYRLLHKTSQDTL